MTAAALAGPCIACQAHCDGTVRGQIGEVTGALCPDCAHWCDGNVTAAPLSCEYGCTGQHIASCEYGDAIAAGDREVVAHGGDASDAELPDCRVCGGEMQARNWPGGIGEICVSCGAWHYL